MSIETDNGKMLFRVATNIDTSVVCNDVKVAFIQIGNPHMKGRLIRDLSDGGFIMKKRDVFACCYVDRERMDEAVEHLKDKGWIDTTGL